MRLKNLKNCLTISVLLLATLCTAAVGNPIYVDCNATSANNGTSWIDAYNFLQDALADANSAEKPVEIWVAQGTYTPDSNTVDPNGTGKRKASFQLINGVSIYGGFPSGGAEFDQRDPNLYEAILSGDLDGNDVPVGDPCDLLNEPTRTDNSYHVVTTNRNDKTPVLDGFTITAGHANVGDIDIWSDIDNWGGGMFNDSNSNPTLTDCTFSGNAARYSGGGMVNLDHSNPNLTNCTFSDNSVEREGGGMYNDSYSSPTLTNCKFSGNSADEGGGMYNDSYSSPTLTNCKFSDNSVEYGGGGMYNRESSLILTNCTFSNNSAEGGGGIYNDWSSPSVTDCTFSDNSAKEGGGMYNNISSSPTLTNCTFSGNSAENDGSLRNRDGGGGMSNGWESNPTLTNCTFSGNSSKYNGGGMYNGDGSPTLTNCTFSGNSAKYDGGGMYNRSESNPILINCTFSGNSATYYGGGMCNRDSRPTLSNCTLATNSAQNGNALACGSYKWKHIELINCILWDGGNEIWNNDNSTIAITFSNIHGGFPGESNIDSDPYFVDPGYWADVNDPDIIVEPNDPNAIWIDGDYHLKSVAGRWDPNSQSWVLDDVRSPCIDTGDPNSCIGFEPNPNGNVVNMGAYGGTAEASLSPSGINCISDDHQDYDEWVKVGEPVCWCYQRQCHGDADCKFEGKNKYWVSTNDLDILIAAWSKPFAEIEGQTLYGLDLVCADFDHKAQGKRKYRVSVNDLDILIAGWNKADEPDPNCP